jgi:hypothetical protein
MYLNTQIIFGVNELNQQRKRPTEIRIARYFLRILLNGRDKRLPR